MTQVSEVDCVLEYLLGLGRKVVLLVAEKPASETVIYKAWHLEVSGEDVEAQRGDSITMLYC